MSGLTQTPRFSRSRSLNFRPCGVCVQSSLQEVFHRNDGVLWSRERSSDWQGAPASMHALCICRSYELTAYLQYNNGIPEDSRYAVHADFFKSRLAQLQSPEGQKEIQKVITLTELAEKGMSRTVTTHLEIIPSSHLVLCT